MLSFPTNQLLSALVPHCLLPRSLLYPPSFSLFPSHARSRSLSRSSFSFSLFHPFFLHYIPLLLVSPSLFLSHALSLSLSLSRSSFSLSLFLPFFLHSIPLLLVSPSLFLSHALSLSLSLSHSLLHL